VLIRLDDADAKAELAQAEANLAALEAGVQSVDARAAAELAQAEANLAALEAGVQSVDARAAQEQAMIASRAAAVSQAQAQADLARQQVARYGALAEQGWVSQQRIETERAGVRTAQASVAEAQAALVAEQRTAGVLGSTRTQSVASVEQARAAVEKARIALERTVIRAPVAGVVGARGVRVGQYVRPGGTILSIVPLGDTYVVANFKETQLGRLRIGQTVEIKADAFKGEPLTGHIESFAPATGSEFALIPVENATGNFTKITQRVPVRIRVDRREGAALRPGLSVEVKVDLKSRGTLTFAEAAVAPIQTAAVAGPVAGPVAR